MKKLVMLLLVPLFIGSCQQTKELTNKEKEEIANEVRGLSIKYWELNKNLTSENYEAVKTYFDKDYDKLWQNEPANAVFNFSIVRGYDEFFNTFDEIFEDRASVDFTLKNHHLSVLSREIVIEILDMDYSIINRNGETYGPFETVFSNVWLKSSGKWKFFHNHQTYRKKKVEEN